MAQKKDEFGNVIEDETDPLAGYNAEEQDFLKRNQNQDGSYDFHRVKEALSNDTSYRPYDSQTSDAGQQAANARADAGQSSSSSSGTGTAQSAYGSYLGGGQGAVQQGAPVQAQPDPMIAKIAAQLEADRARQEQERTQMRELVMSQLADATAPVDANSGALKQIIDPQKVALQRSAQRQRSAAVERAGVRGLGDSGAMDTRINQIEQGRGESEAGMIGQILQSEMQAKRGQAAQLLDLAVRSGDMESARTLQGQLATLDQQMTQNRFSQDLGFRDKALGVQSDQFGQNLDFQRYAFDEGHDANRYQFDNSLAYQLAQLQLQGNQGSMGFLGGLL